MRHFLINFVRFSRLHTVIGTSLSITALYLIAGSLSGQTLDQISLLLWTLLSCLGANIYIVGLNQITDVEIDRINKPYLPLASGAFSMKMGYALIFISVGISLVIAFYFGQFLLLTVILSLILGTAYSLPPIRLKRFHFWAAFCIIAVRGLIVNLLLFLHFQIHLSGEQGIPALIWLLTATIFIYSIVIAWFKDIPDMEGDDQYQIMTLSIRWGAKRVFWVGNVLLTLVFITLCWASWQMDLNANGTALWVGHLFLLVALWMANYFVKLNQKTSIKWYYQFIWLLFFSEYFLFALAALVR